MSDFPNCYSCALITGASSGLGEEFAFQLAPHVSKLVLVARRESLLDQIADRIRNRFPHVAVAVFAADLNLRSERDELIISLTKAEFIPDLLVNNAGLGEYGEFLSADWSKIESLLHLNIEALTHLTHALVPEMVRRGFGGVINISSVASLMPMPDFAVYAASKAYVTSFSEALRVELRDHGIPVLAVCPGPVKTGFGEVARRKSDDAELPTPGFLYVPKEQVVSESLRALARNRARLYPSWKMTAAALLITAIPIGLLRIGLSFRPRRS